MDNYTAPAEWPTQGTRERGKTRYQLTNHLSNVLATVSDLRSPVATIDTDSDGTDDARILDAGVISVRDYYPFGGDIEGRTLASGTPSDAYKYGFNGKEDNPAWSADAVVQDYGFRLYSPGIGRFLSTDPLTSSYPMLTPYQFASNGPIQGIDVDGLEKKITIQWTIVGSDHEVLGRISATALRPTKGWNEIGGAFAEVAGQKGAYRSWDYFGSGIDGSASDGIRETGHQFVSVTPSPYGGQYVTSRYKTYGFWEAMSDGIFSDEESVLADGGIQWELSWGQGKETRTSSYADIGGDIGPLLSIATMVNATSSALNPAKYGPGNTVELVVDLVARANGQSDAAGTLLNEFADPIIVVDPVPLPTDSSCLECSFGNRIDLPHTGNSFDGFHPGTGDEPIPYERRASDGTVIDTINP